MNYPIVSIPADAREDTEQLGSKPEFWVLLDGRRWLFKEARPDTGEDWAEKAAAEVAKAIGINAATVDLAEYAGRRGSISLNFVDEQAGQALVPSVAPSFDHASSLGRELHDERRLELLQAGRVPWYFGKA